MTKKAEKLTDRGIILNLCGEKEEAIKAYDQAISIDPKYVIAYCSRGEVYNKIGKMDLAIQSFLKAEALFDENNTAGLSEGNVEYIKCSKAFVTDLLLKSNKVEDTLKQEQTERQKMKSELGKAQDEVRQMHDKAQKEQEEKLSQTKREFEATLKQEQLKAQEEMQAKLESAMKQERLKAQEEMRKTQDKTQKEQEEKLSQTKREFEDSLKQERLKAQEEMQAKLESAMK